MPPLQKNRGPARMLEGQRLKANHVYISNMADKMFTRAAIVYDLIAMLRQIFTVYM